MTDQPPSAEAPTAPSPTTPTQNDSRNKEEISSNPQFMHSGAVPTNENVKTTLSAHILPLLRQQTHFMQLTHRSILKQRNLCFERIDSLADQILMQEIPTIQEEFGGMMERLEELEMKHQSFVDRVVEHQAETLREHDEYLEEKFHAMLENSLNDLREELTSSIRDDLHHEMDQAEQSHQEEVNTLNQRIETLEERVSVLEKKDQEAKQQDEKLASILKQLETLQSQQSDYEKRHTSLEEAFQESKQNINKKLDGLQQQQKDSGKSLQDMVKKDEDRAADVTFIKKKMGTISSENASNAHNLSVLSKQLDDLTDAYNEFTEKSHENFQVVQSNIEDVAIAHDNLRESISNLEESYKALDERVFSLEVQPEAGTPVDTSLRLSPVPPSSPPATNAQSSKLKWNEILTADDCTVTEDRNTITRRKVTNDTFVTSIGTKLFQRGQHTWKVQVKNLASSRNIYLGIVDPSKIKVNQQSIHESSNGWCISLSDFKCYHNGEAISDASLGSDTTENATESNSKPPAVRNGDIVTFVLSLDNKTLQIKMNGKQVSQLSNIITPVSPAISLGPEKSLSASFLNVSG